MNDATSMTFRFLSPRNVLAMMAGAGLYMGIALRNPTITFLGIAAALAMLAAFVQAAGLLRSWRVRRVHSLRAFEGQMVPVTLELENDGSVPQSLVLLEDQFPPGDTWRIRHLVEERVARNQRVDVHYMGECNHRRGLYAIGPLKMEARDGLGLFRKELLVEEVSYLLVYPTAVELQMVNVLGDGTLAHVGTETTDRAGDSTEFRGTRPYRIGDSPSAIHWPSSARAGELIVREFEELMTTEVTLMVDLGRMGLTGLGDQTSIEYAIKSAASLARRAANLAHAVQLYAIGKDIEYIPAGRGDRHLLLILDRLALLKSEGDADFIQSVHSTLPLLTPGGTVFLILSATTLDVERMPLLIHAMRRRKLLPVVTLIDDRAFIKLYREQEERHITALSLEEVANRLLVEGARVHIVTKAKSPAQALLQGLDREYHAEEAEAASP